MKSSFILVLALMISNLIHAQNPTPPPATHKIAIAVHGGASNIKSLNLTPAQDSAYRQSLSEAVDRGYLILKNGGKAVDAVAASVKYLEDNPLFNAGKGAAFSADSTNEMDAAIMDGSNLKCGAVTGVRIIKNPILCAARIMDSSQFIFLSGRGAEKFARKHKIEIVSPEYFKTEFRWQQFLKARKSDTTHLDNESRTEVNPLDENKYEKFGTVGCVAVDQYGNIAAATSTGGIVNKKYDRIGDSPIIGAGTYANNATCAVSCTGKGEDFIRLVVAHDISALMSYKHNTLKRAVNTVIQEKLKAINGRGGCIAIDRKGNIVMSFTTSGMFRAAIDKSGKKTVAIYDTEK